MLTLGTPITNGLVYRGDVDGSEASHAAWLHARQMQDRFKCAIEAVFIREPLYTLPLADYPEELLKKVERKLIAKLKLLTLGRAVFKVVEGNAAIVLSRAASSNRYGLVVMGSHGHKVVGRMLLGSVAEALSQNSKIPVLVVKNKPVAVKSILAPVNFKDYATEGFKLALEAATAYKARVVPIHAVTQWDQMKEIDEAFDDLLRKIPLSLRQGIKINRLIGKGPSPIQEILKEARRHQMVVITGHRKRLLKEWVLGTTAERVLRYSPVSVLIMPSGI